MGIWYGGFVGLDYARRYQHRLHTLTVSGILLTHEELFQMYEDISLRFYRGSLEIFELYTHYMYEKIFGEAFVLKCKDKLDGMRAAVLRAVQGQAALPDPADRGPEPAVRGARRAACPSTAPSRRPR